MIKIIASFGIFLLLVGVLFAQTVILDQSSNEIQFSDLNAKTDATAAGNAARLDPASDMLITDATTAVSYGPWGCNFTLQPLDFNCGKPVIPPSKPDVLKEQEVILEFLRNKRDELNAKSLSINQKETEVAALEKRVESKIDELRELNNKIEKERLSEAELQTANLGKIVSYYEKIPAENAAPFFAAMNAQTAAMILTRMNPRRVAAILTELEPAKAASLTEDIAKIKSNREAYLNLTNNLPNNLPNTNN